MSTNARAISRFETRAEEKVQSLLLEIKEKLGDCKLQQVAKGDNREADLHVKMTEVGERHLTWPLPFEVLQAPATKAEQASPINFINTWMTPIYKFIIEDELPTNELVAK